MTGRTPPDASVLMVAYRCRDLIRVALESLYASFTGAIEVEVVGRFVQ